MPSFRRYTRCNIHYKSLKTMLLFLFINVKIEENTSI